jgi:hypothetical protein
VLGTCILPPRGAERAGADCERILGSLALRAGSVLALGPRASYARAIDAMSSRLDSAATSAGAELQKAATPATQAAAATALARAYERAAASAKQAAPGPREQETNGAILTSLRQLAGGYSAMASAARAHSSPRFNNAGARVRAGRAALRRAMGQLGALGYSTIP